MVWGEGKVGPHCIILYVSHDIVCKGGQSKKFVPHHPPRRARPDLKTKLKMPTFSRISLILMPAHAKVFGNERQSPLGVGEATT